MTGEKGDGEPAEPVEPVEPTASGHAFNWGLASTPEPAAETAPIDVALAGAPAPVPDPPTVALPWETTTPPEPRAPATELLGAAGSAASPIDSLFGQTHFKDYEGESLIGGSPVLAPKVETPNVRPGSPRVTAGAVPRNQKVLLWVAGGLVALLALFLLFLLGTKLPGLIHSTPVAATSKAPSVSPSPTPSATVSVAPVGPVAVGVHKWSELRGGECIDPFTSPFAETFTVVDCTAPHPAQMVFRGTFPAGPAAPAAPSTPSPSASASAGASSYPGVDALQAQINLLCTAPGVIDLATAGAYNNIQFQAAYAANAAEWDGGQHDYFCFVSRSSGEPITGSVAVQHAGG